MDYIFWVRCLKRPRPLGTALLCAVVLAAAQSVEAQEVEEVTVTAAPTPAAPMDAATQGTVSAEQLQEFPTYRPGEMLEAVPGLIVTQHSGEGKANQYFLRGFNLDHGTDIDISARRHAGQYAHPCPRPGLFRSQFHDSRSWSAASITARAPISPTRAISIPPAPVTIDYVDTLPHDLASVSAGTLGDYRGFTAHVAARSGAGNLLLGDRIRSRQRALGHSRNFNKGNLVLRYSQGAPLERLLADRHVHGRCLARDQPDPCSGAAKGLINLYGPLDPTDGGRSERYSLSGKYAETDETASSRRMPMRSATR